MLLFRLEVVLGFTINEFQYFIFTDDIFLVTNDYMVQFLLILCKAILYQSVLINSIYFSGDSQNLSLCFFVLFECLVSIYNYSKRWNYLQGDIFVIFHEVVVSPIYHLTNKIYLSTCIPKLVIKLYTVLYNYFTLLTDIFHQLNTVTVKKPLILKTI